MLLLLAGAACLALLAARQSQPKYKNKPLSYWIARYRDNYPPGIMPYDGEVRDALQAIGTNALPFLLSWGNYDPPGRLRLRELSIDYFRYDPYHLLGVESRIERQVAANTAFSAFRTNAHEWIPLLTPFLTNRSIAIDALAQLGPQGLSALLTAWSNCTDQNLRREIESTVVQYLPPDNRDTNFVPLLISAIQQGSASEAASNHLFFFTNTPAH